MDADDLIEPEMFQKLLEIQVEYSADIVCCSHKSLSKRGFLKGIDRKENSVIHTTGKAEAVLLASGMPQVDVFQCGKLYKRVHLIEAQKEIQSISSIFIGDDNALNIAVFDKAKKVIIISDRMYLYRMGGSSLNGTEKNMQDLSQLYEYRKQYLIDNDAEIINHRSNAVQILNIAVCLAHYSEKTLSREMICSKLENVIEDINSLHPNYRYKDAFDLNIPMTDTAFKMLYHESVSTRVKQFLLKIF